MIPGSANPLLLKSAAAAAGGYQVSRSLRFNSSDSAFCSRTPAVAGNRKTWTWAGWVKLGTNFGGRRMLFGGGNIANSIPNTYLEITDSAQLGIDSTDPPSFSVALRTRTTAVLRDPSAWYHIVFSIDTTQATAANRIKIYINGVEQTSYSSTTYPSQNYDSGINSTQIQTIGAYPEAAYRSGLYFDGYLADIHFIDGQALTPSSFTEVSATTGQLEPKAYTGSFGTNGFWLKFSDNSAATAATLGKDYSGNSNNWTPNNFSVTAGANYLPYLTSSNNSLANGLNAFDASVSTLAYGSGGQLDFAPSPAISYSSSVEIYLADADGRNQYNFNSGGWVSPSPNSGWITVASGSGTLTTLSARDSISSGQISVAAYRIDGSILVDQRAAGKENDSLVDSPTSFGTDTYVGGEVRGNYCTLNPLNTGATSLANGNLEVTTPSTGYGLTYSTIAISSGKWYWEVSPSSMTGNSEVGIAKAGGTLTGALGAYSSGYSYVNSALKGNNNSYTSYGASYTTNDIIGVALDLDAGTLVFYKNGSSQGTAFSSLSGEFFPAISDSSNSGGSTFTANFGQRAFAHPAPSGFKALCTQNLPSPLIAKPNTVMDVLTWSGSGGNRSFSSLGFSPDFVWIKQRNAAYTVGHQIYDIVRGAGSLKQLDSSNTTAEGGGNTNQYGYLSSFDSNGFGLTVGSVDSDYVNKSGVTYVAWTWDAGSSTVTNTQGSITSQVRANVSAGFSVVTYTGNGTNGATVGHGLGVAPTLFIVKRRDSAANWIAHTTVIDGSYDYLYLNLTNAKADSGLSAPTSTIFQVGNGLEMNGSGATYVGYCFAPVVGYSSMGSYVGNSSADGPFVYTGFRPRFIMVKNAGATTDWVIVDTARETFNVVDDFLRPNLSAAEGTRANLAIDILSNGFKHRGLDNYLNGTNTHVYIAFAESPFQYARAR